MNLSLILIVVVLGIYLVWKLMGTGSRTKRTPRRFEIGRHRKRRSADDEEDES